MFNQKTIRMKTKLVVLALLVAATNSFGQFSFGVSPGVSLNGAYFGYKINNKVVPYIGFQYMGAKLKYEQSGKRVDWDLYQIVSYTDKDQYSGSLIIPNFGIKYFTKQKDNLKAYLVLSFAKPFLTGKAEHNGVEDKDVKEDIKSIKMWETEFGFGAEYFLSDHFSFGGEFGLRYFKLKYQNSYNTTIYDPNTGNPVNTEINTDINFRMSPTYSKISLNYYF